MSDVKTWFRWWYNRIRVEWKCYKLEKNWSKEVKRCFTNILTYDFLEFKKMKPLEARNNGD